MKLLVETLFAKNSDGFDDFYNIYSVSFPLSEQKSKEGLLEMSTAELNSADFCKKYYEL